MTCKENLHLKEGECIPDDGYYVDKPEEGAKKCHKTCKTCNG